MQYSSPAPFTIATSSPCQCPRCGGVAYRDVKESPDLRVIHTYCGCSPSCGFNTWQHETNP